MASGIIAVLDDIAALMDDVAMASKIATKKTAGILGDDLAVNAEKATGFVSSRELPVLWAITKGSLLNKIIIVPIALLLNYFLPVAIMIILILGGLYLAFEGMEKIIHVLFHKKENTHEELEMNEDPVIAEKAKIKSAITTDFILSVEIVIIALGSVLAADMITQILTVSVVALLATFGVYGIVALIVRMDDVGLAMVKKSKPGSFKENFGNFLIKALPIVIKALSYIGTAALILVAGGIFSHNIPFFHHFMEDYALLRDIILGIAGGLLAFGLYKIFSSFKTKKNPA